MFVRSRTSLPRKRKKKGAYRLFATSAFVMSAALAGPTFAQQPAPAASDSRAAAVTRSTFPRGPLDAALKAFAAATGTTLDLKIPPDTAAMMTSSEVSGSFTFEAALTRLLDGTSLGFQRTGSTVSLKSAASKSRLK